MLTLLCLKSARHPEVMRNTQHYDEISTHTQKLTDMQILNENTLAVGYGEGDSSEAL